MSVGKSVLLTTLVDLSPDEEKPIGSGGNVVSLNLSEEPAEVGRPPSDKAGNLLSFAYRKNSFVLGGHVVYTSKLEYGQDSNS